MLYVLSWESVRRTFCLVYVYDTDIMGIFGSQVFYRFQTVAELRKIKEKYAGVRFPGFSFRFSVVLIEPLCFGYSTDSLRISLSY